MLHQCIAMNLSDLRFLVVDEDHQNNQGPERRRDDNLAERNVTRRTMSGRRRCITQLQPAC